MVQKKLCLDVQSNGTKPENRFSNLITSQELKKKKMKRTRPTRLKDTVSKPGKPPPVLDHEVKDDTTKTMTTPSPQKQGVAKVTDGSPNYMKGTTSSQARNVRGGSDMEILRGKKKPGAKLSGSDSKIEKKSKGLCRNSSLKMTKTPSFKRCSRVGRCSDIDVQRATCSSTLKDSKFPEYLILSPNATEAEGTSAFKVCPYTYCSLNGQLHAQYPPLKSFMSARRRALKAQRGTKKEAFSPRKEITPSLAGEEIISLEMQEKGSDGFVEIYVAKKKESKRGNGFAGEGDGQVSESLSDGAPHSEIDSEESFGFCHNIYATTTDPYESFVAEEGDKEYPSLWPPPEASETGSDFSVMAIISEIGGFESKEANCSDNTANGDAQSECFDFDTENMLQNQAVLEQSEKASDDCIPASDGSTEETADVNKDQDAGAILINLLLSEDPIIESPVASENIIQTGTDAEMEDDDHSHTPDDCLSLETKSDAGNADKEGSDKDGNEEQNHLDQPKKKGQDGDKPDKQKMYEFELTEEPQEIDKVEGGSKPDSKTDDTEKIQGVQTEKSVFTRGQKSSKISQHDEFNKWIIKCKRSVEEREDLRAFNPREPNYLPIVPEPDTERVDLKHLDIEERKNTEDWMIDNALQRAVSRLAPAKKKKVALLVEAFETVMPVSKCQTHVKESTKAFACGMAIQACN